MLYTFHDYVLDTQRHELRQQGVPVPLERKAYQVLLYLVQQADRLVTKHELLEAVWPAVYVNDSAVARCIGAVRQAVGDRRATQRVIRTVHGQGYRFVAPVVAHPATPCPRPAAPPPSRPAAAAPAPPAPPGPPVPLVGRAAEVAQLHACLAAGAARQAPAGLCHGRGGHWQDDRGGRLSGAGGGGAAGVDRARAVHRALRRRAKRICRCSRPWGGWAGRQAGSGWWRACGSYAPTWLAQLPGVGDEAAPPARRPGPGGHAAAHAAGTGRGARGPDGGAAPGAGARGCALV